MEVKTFKQHLQELKKLSGYSPSRIEMPSYSTNSIVIMPKKLRGLLVGIRSDSPLRYSIGLYNEKSFKKEGEFGAVTPHAVTPHVEIQIQKFGKMWQTDHIRAGRKTQGQGFAYDLYLYILKEFKVSLVSGDEQSPGGRAMWVKLWKESRKDKKLSVYGYRKGARKNRYFHLELNDDDPTELIGVDDDDIYTPPISDEIGDEYRELNREYSELASKKFDLKMKKFQAEPNEKAKYEKELEAMEKELEIMGKKLRPIFTAYDKKRKKINASYIVAYYKGNKPGNPFKKLLADTRKERLRMGYER